jgi:hypothetical protein
MRRHEAAGGLIPCWLLIYLVQHPLLVETKPSPVRSSAHDTTGASASCWAHTNPGPNAVMMAAAATTSSTRPPLPDMLWALRLGRPAESEVSDFNTGHRCAGSGGPDQRGYSQLTLTRASRPRTRHY